MSLIVHLPFPSAELFPNRRLGKHWSATNRAKENDKGTAYMLTKQALYIAGPQEWKEHIPLSLLFLTPDKRKRDLDGMHAAAKHLLDGMAQALGVDDSRFKPVLVDWVHGDKPGGLIAAVGVRIESGVSL